jgi:hypothetical protein
MARPLQAVVCYENKTNSICRIHQPDDPPQSGNPVPTAVNPANVSPWDKDDGEWITIAATFSQ